MFIVHVFIRVEPGSVDAFVEATKINAQRSRQEAGIVRFDLLADRDAPNHFVLVEIYRTPEDAALHKQTAHYTTWRDTVAPMMAEPRSSLRLINRDPDDHAWNNPHPKDPTA